MGWSGRNGKALWQATTTTRGVTKPYGAAANVAEVVGWYAETRAQLTSYPHSESGGCDDVSIGSKSVVGTVDVKLTECVPFAAGTIVKLFLYSAAIHLSGLAVIESTPIGVRVDGGEPIVASYRFRSKLPWTAHTGYLTDVSG